MIKAIITDIDGVIVGAKHGINFPLPNNKVIQKLKELHKGGLPIVLCTAKFQCGIQELVKKAELSNPHITDGGALIIDPLDNLIIKKHTVEKQSVEKIISRSIENNIYIEAYGVDDYFIQKDQICEITEQHTPILQQEPKIVDDLLKAMKKIDVIKLITYARNDQDKLRIESLLEDMEDGIHTIWTMHPTMLPTRLCIITLNGVSKKAAAEEVMEYLKVSPEETLGIGDTLGDWKFMSMCKYAATVGDESDELKELVKTKGAGNYFISSSVDEDGFLDIIDYFLS